MKNNKLCERVEGSKLHIYINSDKFTNEGYNLCTSYDEETLAYAINLKECNDIEKAIDEIMGILGRDTQNWFHNDIVIHWGVNTWTFYNARNISDFGKEEFKYFDPKDYDIR